MDDLIFALIVSDEICTYYLISLVGGILYHYMHWGNGITLDVLYHVQRNWYYKILIYLNFEILFDWLYIFDHNIVISKLFDINEIHFSLLKSRVYS